MPGILPLKVISLGTTTPRIAQACDRCRSKKIKCDGLAPSCSQCTAVGFECKTSDKLSRRAFPRGYTESLEERVRSLELEIRELKDLLDEKDEKIDLVSKLNSQSPQAFSRRSSSAPFSTTDAGSRRVSVQQDKKDTFKLHHVYTLQKGDEGSDPHFIGPSNVRAFIDSFRRKVQESGRPCAEFDTNRLIPKHSATPPTATRALCKQDFATAPPRLLSDQMVNTFFQEWAPLFPAVHRPTLLKLYQQYIADPTSIEDTRDIAQLNLIFCIGAVARESCVSPDTARCERHWRAALTTFDTETSMVRLQCLLMAQIYAVQRGDWDDLCQFKSTAVGLALRLGLHLSQKRFAMGALTAETRKKVFWTLYTLDCFSAAASGQPRMLKDEDIECEYPSDVDDEYVTESGFQPTLPGESTRLSSSLALFRVSRILARVLEQNYPVSNSQDLSLLGVSALDEELDAWYNNLAPHLKLEFVQDKPSTHVISSRCPLLSLTYQYIRVLIHRPAVSANLGDKAASSVVALASSSKRIIQILQLLEERSFSLSHCLNKNELLMLSGFGLLFQAMDLDKESKLLQDNARTVSAIIGTLDRQSVFGAFEFKRLASTLLPIGHSSQREGSTSSRSSTDSLRRRSCELSAAQRQFQDITNRYSLAIEQGRLSRQPSYASVRAARPDSMAPPAPHRSSSKAMTAAVSGQSSNAIPSPVEQRAPDSSTKKAFHSPHQPPLPPATAKLNLDYFSFPHTPTLQQEHQPAPLRSTDWSKLMQSLGEVRNNQIAQESSDWSVYNDSLSPLDNACLPTTGFDVHDAAWQSDMWDLAGSVTNVASSNSDSVPSTTTLSTSGSSEEGAGVLLNGSDEADAFKSLMMASYSLPDTPDACTLDFSKEVHW